MIINIISLIICSLSLIVGFAILLTLLLKKQNSKSNNGEIMSILNQTNSMQNDSIRNYTEGVSKFLSQNMELQRNNLQDIQIRLEKVLQKTDERLVNIQNSLEKSMEKLQVSNTQKLEEMRMTVDEKLNVSLERRLSESFNLISSRLEAVYRGLGEMQSLATGVGDLKKVLTNVKTRGVWGEVSLLNLLEQILTSRQFEKNVQIKQNSQERVDFVIKLPGKDGEEVLLPIDAKFPIEDYQRLVDTSESGDPAGVEMASKALEKRVKEEAKSICEKYINVPHTTDFALMYLPIEGLYAEVVRNSGLIEYLQQTYKIIVCGPNTISALLSSLQIGFKTLTIEKRSSEIWSLLSVFKKEFENFSVLLSKTQKKLEEASSTIESASKKTNTIAKKLKSVYVPDGATEVVLDIEDVNDDEN